jgi:TetR/AcrR family transcriptional repressor of nem operon
MSVGRPRTFNPDEALQDALECFWSQGYEATSMSDLLQCTGLSKSSLYESFGSKRSLFERCLERYREDRVALMTERLDASASGIDFIRQMLESAAAESGSPSARGCLVMNTATEFAQKDPQVARLVGESIAAFSAVFRKAIRRAQAEGEVSSAKDASVLARFVVTNMSGLRTLAKAGVPLKSLKAVVQTVIASLQG